MKSITNGIQLRDFFSDSREFISPSGEFIRQQGENYVQLP